MMSPRRRLAVAVAVLAATATGIGIAVSLGRSGPSGDSRARLLRPDDALADGGARTAATAIGIARAAVYGEPEPPADAIAELGRVAGARVFFTAYGIGPPNDAATGRGESLLESTRRAARALADRRAAPVWIVDRPRLRLKLDVVVGDVDARFESDLDGDRLADVGLDGYWVERGDHAGWVLPSEVLEGGLATLDDGDEHGERGVRRSAVIDALKRRDADLDLPPDQPFDYVRLRTSSWIERPGTGDRPREPLALYRIHPRERDEPTPGLLLQRAVWATDALSASISAEGEIRYVYLPDRDAEGPGYNLLRHAGTTYALLQAYDRTRFEPYLDAAVAAIEFLLERHTRTDVRHGPSGGGATRWIDETEREFVKLGGPGLALLMLTQYFEARGEPDRWLEEARELARFVVAQQLPTGELISFASRDPSGTPSTRRSVFYPGEAILGLIRLYAWDSDPRWLETAERAARWIIEVREGGKDATELENDHWLMIALSYLFTFTDDPLFYEHGQKLTMVVARQFARNLDAARRYPDYRGGYYGLPRSTPAATRGEGLTAVLDSTRVAGSSLDNGLRLLRETVTHQLTAQYTPESSYWLPNPAEAFGAFHGGILDTSIRNDFIQHNLSAVLGLERHLRAANGEVVPGGPLWTLGRARGEIAAFGGVPAEEMARLRAASVAVRGRMRWELDDDEGGD